MTTQLPAVPCARLCFRLNHALDALDALERVRLEKERKGNLNARTCPWAVNLRGWQQHCQQPAGNLTTNWPTGTAKSRDSAGARPLAAG